ncbi:MAG TPA: AMP-binding protein [Acidimicrobiales bacterium]|nr:AMP-binding protein [Acidimicrobiales bacterium]
MPELDAASAAATGMVIAVHAATEPERPAVVAGERTLSYGELNRRANQLARVLRERGVAAGDGLALMCSNRPEFVEVYAACLRSGLRMTTVNWHLTADEAGYIIGDCEAKAVVADARFSEVAAAAAADLPRGTVRLSVGGAIPGFEPLAEVLEGVDGSDIDDPVLGATMLYTSGTTGRPKGVYRPQRPPTSPAVLGLFAPRPGDVHLCTGPLYHAAPLAFSLGIPLSLGATVVLMDGWSAEATLQLIERHRVTHVHMVPTMFHRLLSLPEHVREGADLSSLRFVVHGAAPCPVHVKQRLISWLGPIVFEYYAATEGTATWVDSASWLERPGTVGKVHPPDTVRILDPDGQPLPPGEPGLVYIKAPEVGRFEYFKDAAKTQSTYLGDHFCLGDVGYLDEDGYLFLTDRSANLIISGGVNIYPAEVDAVLLEDPRVGDAATIGVPDEEWGETVLAVVEPAPGVIGDQALAAELAELCRSRLAHYKCPRRIEFVDELPRHDNGKIYKRLLRDRFREVSPR